MEGYVWQPSWLRALESFLSVLLKVAFATAADVASLAQQWLGWDPFLRMGALLPTRDQAYAACDRMSLPRARAADMFCGFADGTLEQRQRFNMRMRWCPECAKHWFHSPVFQDWRLARCPWHGVRLADECAKCGLARDLYRNPSWTCACGEALAPETRDWPQRFRAELPAPRSAEEQGWLHSSPRALDGGRFEVRLLEDAEPRMLRDVQRDYALETDRHCAMAFEEASALLDCVVGDHGECSREETTERRLYEPGAAFSFHCPVAAASNFLGAMTGCRCRWQVHFRTEGSLVDSDINRIAQGVTARAPRWLHRVLIRDLVLAMFQGALELYLTTAKRNPAHRGIWSAPAFRPCTWSMAGDDVAVLKPTATVGSVSRLIADADLVCPWTRASRAPAFR